MAIALHPELAAADLPASIANCAACHGSFRPGRPALRAARTGLPFDLHRCPDCGLIQQQPRSTAAGLAALYDADYYVFNEAEPRRWARAAQQYLIHIRPNESRSPKRLLDVGCARGHLCAIAKRRGWRVTGIDISGEAVSHAAVQFGLDARAGSLARHVATLPRFDVVFLGDLIEHVHDASALMKDVRSVLAPGGLVCIDTPNWNSRWRRLAARRWLGLNRFHVNLFAPSSLTRLLEASGFQPERVDSYTHYAYDTFAARPELEPLMRVLPTALRWRMNSALSRLSAGSTWADLRRNPPETLEAATEFVDRAIRKRIAPRHSRSLDNLIAVARRR